MAISYQDIRTERQCKAATGVSAKQFAHLTKLFGEAYEDLFGESISERRQNSSQDAQFESYADLLFFGLYSIKSGLTYDLIALSFNLSPSNAHANQATVLTVLQAALEKGGWMPKRAYTTDEEFIEDWRKEAAIMVDATEQKRQRPGNQEDQKAAYSGKKKPTRSK
jgi:hypothetical protein